MSKTGEIRRDKICLENNPESVQLNSCHGQEGNQFWEFNDVTRHLMNGGNCMAINENRDKILMEPCSSERISQKWLVENVV